MKLLATALLMTMTNSAMSDMATDTIEQMIESDRARAIVIAGGDGGPEVYLEHAGDFGDIDVTKATFEIGSISKVFTSLLVQILVDEEKTDWDLTLGDAIPDLEFASEQIASITLRELATHTSGLPRLPDNMVMADPMDPYAGYGREELLEYLAGLDPDNLVKSYEYSNLGAGLLGMIGGDIAGTNYHDAMRAYVFEPLRMHNSAVGLRDYQNDILIKGFSDGADMANWSGFDALAGAGAITSNVEDMKKFVAAHFGGSSISGSMQSILEPQGDGETALGWHIEPHPDGDAIHWHNGGTGGYTSFLSIRNSDKSFVLVLAASTEYGAVTELGFNLATGRTAETPMDLEPFEGVFQIAEGFYLTVYAENGRLMTQATGQGALSVEHEEGDIFVYEPADITLDFNRDKDGSVPSIDFTQQGRSMTIPRVDDSFGIRRMKTIDVASSILDDYVGQYQLAPGAVFSVFRRDNQLFAQLTGQTAYPVFAYEPDKFFYKVVDARLSFVRGADGAVESLVLNQGGEHIAPRIAE